MTEEIKEVEVEVPAEWLIRKAKRISKDIINYNKLAKEHDLDRIVAFTMSEEDYMEKMKEEVNE